MQYANQRSGQAEEVAEQEQGEPIKAEFRTLPSVSEIDQRQWLVGMCLNGLLSNPNMAGTIHRPAGYSIDSVSDREALVFMAKQFAQEVIDAEG